MSSKLRNLELLTEDADGKERSFRVGEPRILLLRFAPECGRGEVLIIAEEQRLLVQTPSGRCSFDLSLKGWGGNDLNFGMSQLAQLRAAEVAAQRQSTTKADRATAEAIQKAAYEATIAAMKDQT